MRIRMYIQNNFFMKILIEQTTGVLKLVHKKGTDNETNTACTDYSIDLVTQT